MINATVTSVTRGMIKMTMMLIIKCNGNAKSVKSIRRYGRKWEDFDSRSIATININNTLMRLKSDQQQHFNRTILERLKQKLSSPNSSNSSLQETITTTTNSNDIKNDGDTGDTGADVFDKEIMMDLLGNYGIVNGELNSEYLDPVQVSIKKDSQVVDSGDKSGLKISSEFQEISNRILLSLNLQSERNRMHFIEQMMMEANFLYSISTIPSLPIETNISRDIINSSSSQSSSSQSSSSQSSSSQSSSSQSSSSQTSGRGSSDTSTSVDEIHAEILRQTMVGIHSDYVHSNPSFAQVGVMPYISHIDYVTSPHYNIQKQYIDSNKDDRILCCVFFIRNELTSDNYESILSGLRYELYQVSSSSSFESHLDTTANKKQDIGGGGVVVGSVEECRNMKRPVNVVLTDGIRWHFSRVYADGYNEQYQKSDEYSKMEKIDLLTVENVYSIDTALILGRQRQRKSSSQSSRSSSSDISKINRKSNHSKGDSSRNNENIIHVFTSDLVLSIARDEIKKILGVLRWWIRGFNAPRNTP